MIINTLDNKKIKILIDKTDLGKTKIPFMQWISDPSKALSYIEQLLCSQKTLIEKQYIPLNSGKIFIHDYSIYTYNYQVFLITLKL